MSSIISNILAAALRSGTPILLVAQGEIISQKAGVMNIGLEGIMLVGAISGFVVSYHSGIAFLGIVAAVLSGVLFSFIHAFFCVILNSSQVLSGFALYFLGTGLSAVLGLGMVGVSAPGLKALDLGELRNIPFIGTALCSHDIIVYSALILTFSCHIFLNKTRIGMVIRGTGDNPSAIDAAGLSVKSVRIICVLISGAFSGLAGAYLSLAYSVMWQPGMTGGQGWIALALVIFSQWKPIRAMGGAYLFGGITALQLALQIAGVQVSAHVLKMLPYLFTIVVLVVTMLLAKRHGSLNDIPVGPASLGIPYSREN